MIQVVKFYYTAHIYLSNVVLTGLKVTDEYKIISIYTIYRPTYN